jgi:hypothetical protein
MGSPLQHDENGFDGSYVVWFTRKRNQHHTAFSG